MEWNYQGLHDKAKKLIMKDAYMKFYDALKALYLETDASLIGLRAGLLRVREGMNCGHHEVTGNSTLCLIVFASRALSSVEPQYSNIK